MKHSSFIIFAVFFNILAVVLIISPEYQPVDNFHNRWTHRFHAQGLVPFTILIHHPLPIPPIFIRMKSELNITLVQDGSSIQTLYREYDLIKGVKDGESTFKISSTGKEIRTADLQITLQTAFDKGVFSTIKYSFSGGFDKTLKYLADDQDFIGLGVNFVTDGNDFLPDSSLAPVGNLQTILNLFPSQNKYLCVLADNGENFIIKPDYIGEDILSKGHIVGIAYKYVFPEKDVSRSGFLTAFGCGNDLVLTETEKKYMVENNDKTLLRTEVEFLFPKILDTQGNEKDIGYVLLDLTENPSDISTLDQISSKAGKVYIVQSTLQTVECNDGRTLYIHVTGEGVPLFGYIYEKKKRWNRVQFIRVPISQLRC